MIRAAWIKGDDEADRLLDNGCQTQWGAYELFVRDKFRQPVRELLQKLNSDLLPFILPRCDPSLRDRLHDLVVRLNPDQVVKVSGSDDTHRWRQSWLAMGLENDLVNLVPLLHAKGDSMVLEPPKVPAELPAKSEAAAVLTFPTAPPLRPDLGRWNMAGAGAPEAWAWEGASSAALGALAQSLAHRLDNAPLTGPEIPIPPELIEHCWAMLRNPKVHNAGRVTAGLAVVYHLSLKAAKSAAGPDWWFHSKDLRSVYEDLGDAPVRLRELAEFHGIDSTPLNVAFEQMTKEQLRALEVLLSRLSVIELVGARDNTVPVGPLAEIDDPANWKTASYFTKKSRPRIRMATNKNKLRKSKTVRTKIIDKAVCYYVPDVARWWSDALPKAT
jgi:hypothetical protein